MVEQYSILNQKTIIFTTKTIDEQHQKIEYTPKSEDDYQKSIGYFIINTDDYAIKERIYKTNPKTIHKIPYTKSFYKV